MKDNNLDADDLMNRMTFKNFALEAINNSNSIPTTSGE